MTPMPWWKRLPARLLEEEQALLLLRQGEVALVRTHRWLRAPDGEPRVNVQLALGSRNIELEVRFPAHYPEGCPSVRPIPYDKPVSSHQFVHSGVFCLELGPDNWHPRYTAADMVASAWRLLAQEFIRTFEPIEIPSRHVSDLAERVRVGKGVLLRSPEFDKCLESAQGNTQFDFVWPTRNLFRIFPVGFPKGVALTDVPVALDNETRSTGLLIRLSEGAPDAAPTEPKEFREFILEHGKVEVEEGVLLVILRWHSGKTRGFCCFPKSTFELVDMPLDLSMGPRAAEPLREALSTLKVGIVGLGSLGSKVAVSLARTGVRRFVLVDGDILEGPNVCRHAADFSDLGAAKVDAVRELIRCVSVGEPEIKRHCVNLATATNPDLHAAVLEDLGTVDILIDATANPDVFGVLAMVASDKRRPMVWGEVFGGGLGGLVAFAHPERGACPRCVRAGFLAEAASWPPAPTTRPTTSYGGGDAEPFVATDADVAFVAAALTNRVFDLVRGDSRPPAVMLFGLRRGWIFETTQAVPVHVRSDDWSCPRCWTTASEPDVEMTALVDQLFSGEGDVDHPVVS